MNKTKAIKRDPARRPTRPGALLREVVLSQLQLTQAMLAARLNVSHVTVSEIFHEKRSVNPDMATRLGKLL